MKISFNWMQRTILGVAGVVLLLSALGAMEGYDSDSWLAAVLFLLAVGCFVLAAHSKAESDG